VKGVVEGARMKLARSVQPKQPLSHDVIADITLSLNTISVSFSGHSFFVYPFGWICWCFSC